MKWFRRSPDEWDVDWLVKDGKIIPSIPNVRPEPWRENFPEATLVPIDFVSYFVNETEINEKDRFERWKCDEVKASLTDDGFHQPMVMYWDDEGRVRFHDGHHRLVAARELGWKTVPVELRHAGEGVILRGYSRELKNHVVDIFASVSVNEEVTFPVP
jgi:ParB-like nuclease domain